MRMTFKDRLELLTLLPSDLQRKI